MEIRTITKENKDIFNSVVYHPLQSFEWGEFRQNSGIKVIRRGFFEKRKLVKAFTLTIHKIPKTPFNIGYLPKGDMPDQELLNELQKIGKEEKCIFIQLEPNVIPASTPVIPAKAIGSEVFDREAQIESAQARRAGIQSPQTNLVPAAHPLFTKYTFILDLIKSEDELLKAMHPKARYNIKVAQKHGVEIRQDNSKEAFEEYWHLMEETTKRQNFYAHTKKYHRLMWETLQVENGKLKVENLAKDKLKAHLLIAKYKPTLDSQLSTLNSQLSTLAAWILFIFKDTLYYPYGASSNENKEMMASNLMVWEAIRFGKKLGLKKFDMWGALGPNPDPKDPWFGFHNFKQKYGPEHVEFIGSYDLVINPLLYQVYKLADKARWFYLKLKK